MVRDGVEATDDDDGEQFAGWTGLRRCRFCMQKHEPSLQKRLRPRLLFENRDDDDGWCWKVYHVTDFTTKRCFQVLTIYLEVNMLYSYTIRVPSLLPMWCTCKCDNATS